VVYLFQRPRSHHGKLKQLIKPGAAGAIGLRDDQELRGVPAQG
jgi:hypothetical protein